MVRNIEDPLLLLKRAKDREKNRKEPFGTYNYFKEQYELKVESLLPDFLEKQIDRILAEENTTKEETKAHLFELVKAYCEATLDFRERQ